MVDRRPHRSWMLGRRAECEALDRLLADVHAAHSRVLVLRGEAGVGKSALLEYVLQGASGCRTARTAGVESEMELPFAALHQLCAPFLDRLERLPGPQREALATVFGQSAGATPDRFLVALAALTLLSDVAEERPLICLVDDAQWLDRASAQALAFAARRLLAEPLGLLFAVREPSDDAELRRLPELVVEGIADYDARRLLASTIPGRLDEQVVERIVAETRGNPLALLELPRRMTPAELAGGFGVLDRDALASCIEESFLRQLEFLTPQTRRLLLTAAAEPLGDLALLWRATERLGVGIEAATPAEAAGLIELGAWVRFRHPLVRSAVYRAAAPAERRQVHRAIAESTDPEADPDRRAWHLAHAASGPDEAVAAELEHGAGRAQSRGGVAAAAAFLERATELTPDPAQRGVRALAAAQAKWAAGAHEATSELLAVAEMGPLDELRRASLDRVRARISFAWTRGSHAPSLLLAAARRLEPLDAQLARDTYLEALGAAMFRGRLGGEHGVREVAEAARTAPPPPQPPRAMDLVLDGLATRFSEGHVAAVRPLRRAIDVFRREDHRGQYDSGWLLASRIAPDVWADDAWHDLAAAGLGRARDAGALTLLPIALHYRAGVHVHAGEFAAAAALIDEADRISEATGTARFTYTSMVLAGWRGDHDEALRLIRASVQDATATDAGPRLRRRACRCGRRPRSTPRGTSHKARGRHARIRVARQATGETVPRRTAETRDHLTAQEAQIARLAADGHTNPEIGAQLFISPRTVEYHLHKVFAKLDIGSRRELRGALLDERSALAPSQPSSAPTRRRVGTRRDVGRATS